MSGAERGSGGEVPSSGGARVAGAERGPAGGPPVNGPERPPIRVFVVDDQELIRVGISLILDSADGIEVVGEARDGAAAMAAVERLAPDVVLMDVRMPGMDGIEATRRITERNPHTRVIVLTTFDLDAYAFGSLRAGASAFLIKTTRPAALVEAVEAVASGAAIVAPRLTGRLIEHYLATAGAEPPGAWGREGSGSGSGSAPSAAGPPALAAVPPPRGPDPLAVLSPREREVFGAIVRGRTNGEIHRELHLAQSTVKSHVNAIFSKLALRDRVHAVILGYELGLGPDPDPDPDTDPSPHRPH